MNIATLMDQIGTALGSLTGLRVYSYEVRQIAPPAAVVGWPDPLTYDVAFARGADQITLPLYLMVGQVSSRSARDVMAGYLAGSGSGSLKTAVEAGTYTACDAIRVTQADVQEITVGDIAYLGAVFTLDIHGRGTA